MKKLFKRFLLFIVSDRKVESVKTLYPGKSNGEVKEKLAEAIGRKMVRVITASLIVSGVIIAAFRLKKPDKESPVFYREDMNGGSKLAKIILSDGNEDFPVEFVIHPVLPTDAEIDAMQDEICAYLDTVVTSDGTFSTSEDIFLPETIEGYPVDILWSTENTLIITQKGEVQNSELSEPKEVGIIAKISYGDEFRVYERTVTVLPPQRSEAEQKVFEASEKIRELEEKGVWNKILTVPDELLGFSVKLPEKDNVPVTGICALLSILSVIYVYYGSFSHLEEQKKKKMKAADEEYKNFISKLSLLLSAGLTVRTAMNRLSKEYLKQPEGLLSRNLEITVSEIENGEPESQAYERFGDRMGSVRYKRLSSVLCQAVTKGVRHIEEVMVRENEEATAEEKEMIRIRGENAGTKLLFPMMGFLIIVFGILLVPAFRSF